MAKGFRDPVGSGNVTIAQDSDGFHAVRVFLKKDLDDGDVTGLRHLGVDWNADGGQDANEFAFAAYAGTVAYASTNALGNRGGVVMLNHTLPDGSKYTTVYMHLENIPTAILNGTQKTVVQGQLLGDSGFVKTGQPLHIHYEVREGHQNGTLGLGFGYYGNTTGSVLVKTGTQGAVPWADVRHADGSLVRYFEPLAFTNAFRSLPDPPSSKPDLKIANATIDDTTVSVGDSVRVEWEVWNVGNGAADGSVAGVFLSRDAAWSDDDVRVDTNTTNAMPKGGKDLGESDTFLIEKTTKDGDWYVLVVADYERKVSESNENNNVWSGKISVKGSAGKPDLTIEKTQMDDKTVKPGQKVDVDWSVRNLGTGEAAPSDTFIYISKDKNLSSNELVDHEKLDSMSSKELDPESENITIPYGLSKGSWYLAVVADGGNAVSELREDNNIEWLSFSII